MFGLNQIINKMDNQSVKYRIKIYKSTIGQIFVIHSVFSYQTTLNKVILRVLYNETTFAKLTNQQLK
jgi:hypothetical protein